MKISDKIFLISTKKPEMPVFVPQNSLKTQFGHLSDRKTLRFIIKHHTFIVSMAEDDNIQVLYELQKSTLASDLIRNHDFVVEYYTPYNQNRELKQAFLQTPFEKQERPNQNHVQEACK